jgi:hypothetical protein
LLTTRVLYESIVYCSQSRSLPGKPSADSIYNWRTRGVRCRRTHHRITLEWAYYGGQPVTSREAFDRFLRRINGEEA